MSSMEGLKHPAGGGSTGCYITSDDGSLKVAAVGRGGDHFTKLYGDIKSYEWNEGDFMLSSFPRNGTHFTWEIMTMLLKNSSEYITEPKESCMMDLYPLSKTDEVFPRGIPRVLNTHYRLDVLPKVFHNRKTVLVIRNPKDAAVSHYHFYKQVVSNHFEGDMKEKIKSLTFSDFLQMYMYDHDQPFSTYFDFTKAMWDMAKDNSNFLVIFYEDLKKIPVQMIERLNKFMGTNCSSELINQIADVTSFTKMQEAKSKAPEDISKKIGVGETLKVGPTKESVKKYYRKGEIGDWKNHFTVADNEVFGAFLEDWGMTKEIPYTYE